VSLSDPVVIVTLPLACGRQVLIAADEGLSAKVNEVLAAFELLAAVTLTATTATAAKAPSLAGLETKRRRIGFM